MELNSQTNVFTQGLDMDSDISMIREGAYRYAENVRFQTDNNGTTGALQNIEHIRKYTIGIPEDETILGTANSLLFDDNTKSTYEIGIVITKKIKNNTTYNTIYVVRGFESVDVETVPIACGYLEITDNVSMVTNYESNLVSSVYITDGKTPIKVINIVEQFATIDKIGLLDVTDPTRFDITPGCVLLPFSFDARIDGVLPCGSIQYAYQLFNTHGGETSISAVSDLIPIANYGNSVKETSGGIKGDVSNMGCQITTQFMNDGRFNRMRIYAIVYLDNISVPNIYIANEISIPNNLENEFITCTYQDTGNSYLSQITIDEFNALIPYQFSAKTIESLQNRLFVANITEHTWDIEFDARAYSTEGSSRRVRLQSSGGSSNQIDGYLQDDGRITNYYQSEEYAIPEEHDCINPSNLNVTEIDQQWTYRPDLENTSFGTSHQHGGLGPNVSYRFTYTPLVLSQEVTTPNVTYPSIDIKCNNIARELHTYYEDGTECKITNVPNNGTAIPNYSDPFVCANFLGYQRDEIYRFGIVLYNNKNIPSPVHWIADIRIPSGKVSTISAESGSKPNMQHPFHCGVGYPAYTNSTKYEMVAYAIGIEFTVKNLPEEVHSYEIVRCDRTAADRTVVCQGALSATCKWDTFGDNTTNYGDTDTRPLPHLMLPNNYFYSKSYNGDDELWGKLTVRKNCFEFASPEMCISKDAVLPFIKNGILVPQYYAMSYNIRQGNDTETPKFGIAPQTVSQINGEGKTEPNYYYTTLYPIPHLRSNDGHTYYDVGALNQMPSSGTSLVCKYYIHETSTSGLNTTYEIDESIITNALPLYRKEADAKNYIQFVGDYAFVNVAMGVGINRNHGICGVITTKKDFNAFIPLTKNSVSTFPVKNEFNTTAICNIKRNIIPYGGNTYGNRLNSIYQSCGCMKTENLDQPIVCHGGDTYLCIFDYQNTVIQMEGNDIAAAPWLKNCTVSYIPLETVINLNLRSDESFSKKVQGMTAPNEIQLEPTVFQNYVQKEPLYLYNSVYSQTSGSKMYVAKGMYAEDDMVNNVRIMCSEVKTNNAILDNWTKFKVANYLDVDNKFGEITNLKRFKDRLYFWQKSAVGIASVNERSLITDNNMAALTLGTGGILSRFDYVTEQNGSSRINDKSIIASDSFLYWYDLDKNVLCQMGNNLNHLSKALNVQSYLNSLHSTAKTNAVSFYDHKYNEVWFRLYDKALIYNEKLNVFTSFYTHNPNWFFPFSDKLVTIKDNNMYYLHNIYTVNSDEMEERTSKIQFIVNKEATHTKVFDNVMMVAEFVDNNNTTPTVIKDVVFKTRTQETEPISYKDVDVREDNYRFAISREKVDDKELSTIASKSYLGRMRGKYLICDYTFDCNENREFKIPFIKTTYRYSML